MQVNGRLQRHRLFSTPHTYMYFMLLSTCQFIFVILVKHTDAFPMRVRQHDATDFSRGQLNQLLSLNLWQVACYQFSTYQVMDWTRGPSVKMH